jgi:hypothetical protein
LLQYFGNYVNFYLAVGIGLALVMIGLVQLVIYPPIADRVLRRTHRMALIIVAALVGAVVFGAAAFILQINYGRLAQKAQMPLLREVVLSARVPVNIDSGEVIPEYKRESGVEGAGMFYFRATYLSRAAFTSIFKGTPNETPVLPASDRPTTEKEAANFVTELSQYVIFLLIDSLQKGAFEILGGSASRQPILPPEPVTYPSNELREEVNKNRLSRIGEEAELWRHGKQVKVPKDTVIRFGQREGDSTISPTYLIELQNPSLYTLAAAIFVSGTAKGGNPADYVSVGFKVPPNFASIGRVYYLTIKCRFEYRRTASTDAFQQEEYRKWAEALFDGLRTMIER